MKLLSLGWVSRMAIVLNLVGTLMIVLMAVLVNAATPSPAERALWLPVTLVMLAAAFGTAVRGRGRAGSVDPAGGQR